MTATDVSPVGAPAAPPAPVLVDTERYRSIWGHLLTVPFEQGYLDAGGVRTRYWAAGPVDAPVLIMLHGTAGSVETFCANLGPLSEHYRCYAIDMIGSGWTDKPDRDYEIPVYGEHVAAVMDALGVQTASFLGVSLGAWVAARFSLTHPERVNRMIMLSTPGLISDLKTMNAIVANRGGATGSPTWERVASVIDKLVHDQRDAIPDIVNVRRAAYSQPEMAAAMPHILVLQNPEVRQVNNLTEAEWSSIAAPVLVIASIDHDDVWLKTSLAIAELIPNVELVRMPEVSHWPHFEKPDEFNALALRFLAGE